jgi:hypothetical protein
MSLQESGKELLYSYVFKSEIEVSVAQSLKMWYTYESAKRTGRKRLLKRQVRLYNDFWTPHDPYSAFWHDLPDSTTDEIWYGTDNAWVLRG